MVWQRKHLRIINGSAEEEDKREVMTDKSEMDVTGAQNHPVLT